MLAFFAANLPILCGGVVIAVAAVAAAHTLAERDPLG